MAKYFYASNSCTPIFENIPLLSPNSTDIHHYDETAIIVQIIDTQPDGKLPNMSKSCFHFLDC